MRSITNEEFNEKYFLFKPLIFNIAYNYVHNQSDADDITQDVFMKYLKNNKEFSQEENEKYWLIRVTMNTCKSHFSRAWKKRVELSNELVFSTQEETITNSDVYDIILNLPHKYKEIIILHYYEDLRIESIANLLGISLSAAKKRLERARNLIREKENKNG